MLRSSTKRDHGQRGINHQMVKGYSGQMHKPLSKWSSMLVLFSTLLIFQVEAQWLTETIELKAGWNAVFLHVDPSHESLQSLVGSDVGNPITQIWRWNAPNSGQFYDNPQNSTFNLSGWVQWVRNDPNPALKSMVGDTAYLVESASDYTWTLKGRPVAPRHYWNLEGLNLIGFPTVPDTPPKFDVFLDQASDLLPSDFEVYRYSGAVLDATNPMEIILLLYRSIPVQRGQAFWMRSGDVFNTYFGPFEVDLAGRPGISLGENISVFSVRLRNLSDQPVTVSAELLSSESAPSGQDAIAGVPPLLVKGALNPQTLSAGFSPLPVGASNQTWDLAAKDGIGSEIEVVFGVDRSAITEPVGSLLAGILRFTDSAGLLQVNVPVDTTVGSSAGLWVGSAVVSEVNQYLKTYESGAVDPIITTIGTTIVTNDLVITTNGSYSVSGIDTTLTAVPKPFPLRLIVHSPENDNALLLQQVFYGQNVQSNAVISRQESVLDPNRFEDARRITATHLPWSEENPGWSFDGSLTPGTTLSAVVTTDFNDQRSNPFLHTYHPDHDNLDPQFKSEVVQGAESYSIVRTISLSVDAPGTNFTERVSANQTLFGEYNETMQVIGLARDGGSEDTRVFETRGAFKLDRITDIPEITNPF